MANKILRFTRVMEITDFELSESGLCWCRFDGRQSTTIG